MFFKIVLKVRCHLDFMTVERKNNNVRYPSRPEVIRSQEWLRQNSVRKLDLGFNVSIDK